MADATSPGIRCSFILNSSAYRFRLKVASFKKRKDVQELTMLSALTPKSSADCPIMVTPPRFLRTVFDGGERSFEQLLVLHRREDLLDQNVLWNAKIGWVMQ